MIAKSSFHAAAGNLTGNRAAVHSELGVSPVFKSNKCDATRRERPNDRRQFARACALRSVCTPRGWAELIHKSSKSRRALPSLQWTYCLVGVPPNVGGVECATRNMGLFTPQSTSRFAAAECSGGDRARLGHGFMSRRRHTIRRRFAGQNEAQWPQYFELIAADLGDR